MVIICFLGEALVIHEPASIERNVAGYEALMRTWVLNRFVAVSVFGMYNKLYVLKVSTLSLIRKRAVRSAGQSNPIHSRVAAVVIYAIYTLAQT